MVQDIHKRSLVDIPDDELREMMKHEAKRVDYSFKMCHEEFCRRDQSRHAKAVRCLTWVIAAMAVITGVAEILPIVQCVLF